jgi:hypothetical protein
MENFIWLIFTPLWSPYPVLHTALVLVAHATDLSLDLPPVDAEYWDKLLNIVHLAPVLTAT